jgi:hypothetical protein
MIVIRRSSRWDDSDRRLKPASQFDSFQIGVTHATAKLCTAFKK